jgi:hypothetical protein
MNRDNAPMTVRRLAGLVAAGLLAVTAAACTSPPPPPVRATVDVGGEQATVVVAAGHTLELDVVDLADLPELPAGYDFPASALAITVGGVEPGSVLRVTLRLEHDVSTFFKLVGPAWEEFTFDGTTGAVVGADGVVTLHLQDGGRGDSDGVADGTIVDPGIWGTMFTLSNTCYDSSDPTMGDVKYLGPIDTFGNTELYWSTDGSCTGAIRGVVSMVYGPSLADAQVVCDALGGPTYDAFDPRAFGYELILPGYFGCATGLPT